MTTDKKPATNEEIEGIKRMLDAQFATGPAVVRALIDRIDAERKARERAETKPRELRRLLEEERREKRAIATRLAERDRQIVALREALTTLRNHGCPVCHGD